MYRQLQKKAREYVVEHLCQISDKWKFDIDTTNVNRPIIVGSNLAGENISAPIEELHNFLTKDLIDCMVV